MFKRRWPVLLGPPLILLGALLVLGRSDEAVIAGRVVAVPNLAACASTAAAASDHAALGTWWKTADQLDRSGTLTGRELFVGHDAKASGQLALPVESSVSGPTHGVVVVTADDGARSQVLLVSVGARCSTVIDERSDVVRSAIIDPHDGSVFAHLVARDTRADLGTYRISPTGQGAPEATLVAPPLGAMAAEIGTVWATVLKLDHAGTRLAVQSCTDLGCLTRVFDLSAPGTAPRIVRGSNQGPLLGFAASDLIAWDACVGYPCPISTWEVATGRTQPLVAAASAAALTADGRRLVALAADGAGAHPIAVDTETGRTTALLGVQPGGRPIDAGPSPALGLEVADDEVVFASPGGDPVALRPDSAAQEALP
jgi:hypothetical protein